MTAGTRLQKERLHPEVDLALARKIVLDGLAGYAVRVFLFGSRAKGEADRVSDIDIAIWPQENIPLGVFAQIREALEESDILYHVDLVDLSETNPAFRERVLREGIPWKE